MPFHVLDHSTGEIIPLYIEINDDGSYNLSVAASGEGTLALFLPDANTGNMVPIQVTDNGDGTYSPVVSVSGGGSSGITQADADARYARLGASNAFSVGGHTIANDDNTKVALSVRGSSVPQVDLFNVKTSGNVTVLAVNAFGGVTHYWDSDVSTPYSQFNAIDTFFWNKDNATAVTDVLRGAYFGAESDIPLTTELTSAYFDSIYYGSGANLPLHYGIQVNLNQGAGGDITHGASIYIYKPRQGGAGIYQLYSAIEVENIATLNADNLFALRTLGGTILHKTGSAGTIGLAVQAAASQSADLIQTLASDGTVTSRVNKAGYSVIKKTSAPADGDLSNSEVTLWFDAVAGSLKVKAKKSDGTVITGGVVLA